MSFLLIQSSISYWHRMFFLRSNVIIIRKVNKSKVKTIDCIIERSDDSTFSVLLFCNVFWIISKKLNKFELRAIDCIVKCFGMPELSFAMFWLIADSQCNDCKETNEMNRIQSIVMLNVHSVAELYVLYIYCNVFIGVVDSSI